MQETACTPRFEITDVLVHGTEGRTVSETDNRPARKGSATIHASQIFSNLLKSSQMLSDLLKSCQIFSNSIIVYQKDPGLRPGFF